MAALAAVLLAAGGLGALQNGAVLAATPFALVMLALCYCLHKTISEDYREAQRGDGDGEPSKPPGRGESRSEAGRPATKAGAGAR